MSRPAITIYANHPRVFFRDTDVSTLQSRRNSASGRYPWNAWFDSLISYLDTTAAASDPATYYVQNFHLKMLAMSTAYKVTGNAAYADLAQSFARYYVGNRATPSNVANQDIFGEDERREGLIALTAVWDITYDVLSQADRKTLGDCMLNIMDAMKSSSTELTDGHSRIDQAIQEVGALCLLGESGSGFDYTTGASDATTRLNEALDFWFGGNAAVTLNGYPAIGTERFWGNPATGSGSGKGFWYSILANYGSFYLLWALKNACATITLDGDAYDPFITETWFQDNINWVINSGFRGDGEHWNIGNTQRLSNPRISFEQRLTAGMFSRFGANRGLGSWLAAEWQAIQLNQSSTGNTNGQNENKFQRIQEFLLVDYQNAPEVSPSAAGLPLVGFFQRPGAAFCRNTWDFPNSTIYFLNCPEWYYRGHQWLDRGAIQISHKKDVVVTCSGYYHTSDANAKFGGSHDRKWADLSISKSGVPLCDDGLATPHSNYNAASPAVLTAYPSGEGGQLFKRIATKRDSDNVVDMISDQAYPSDPTNAWKAAEGRTNATGMEKVFEDASVAVFYADIRRAYLEQPGDAGTSLERLTMARGLYMYIKDQGFGALLRVVRLQSRLASMIKQDHWHVWGNPVLGNFATNGMIEAQGYRAVNGLDGAGKIFISYDNYANYNASQIGGGSSSGDYLSQQFFYDPHDGSGGANFPPAGGLNTIPRQEPDLGRYRIAVRPKTQQVEDYFVTICFGADSTFVGVNFAWITDPEYFGVTFPDGKVYKLHKTDVRWTSPSDPVSGGAPSQPTGLVASTPATQRVDLTWDPVIVSDLSKYRAYRRVKV